MHGAERLLPVGQARQAFGDHGQDWRGEHLGCSPCGILAVPVSGRMKGPCVADPEVLLSLLPVTTHNYSKNPEFQDTNFKAARGFFSFQRVSVKGGQLQPGQSWFVAVMGLFQKRRTKVAQAGIWLGRRGERPLLDL